MCFEFILDCLQEVEELENLDRSLDVDLGVTVEHDTYGHLVDPARWLDLPAVEREVGGSNLSAVKGWVPDFPIGDLLRWGGQTLMQAVAVQ